MSYIGNIPGENFISFAKQNFTIVNSQTAYTLNFSVADENEIRLVINNVVQEPGTGKAYTASGTTLTLSSALTNGTDEMYCVFLGKARETVTVPTITKDKVNFISDSSSSGVISKGDGSVDGSISLNCSQNSHHTKISSAAHGAYSGNLNFVLPSSHGSSGQFLKTDGSGNLSFAAAGGANTPYFQAVQSTDVGLTDNTAVVIPFNSEPFDSGSLFNNSNGRFVMDSTNAGKYFIYAKVSIDSDSTYTSSGNFMEIKLNHYNSSGSSLFDHSARSSFAMCHYPTVQVGGFFNLANGDYVNVTLKVTASSLNAFGVNTTSPSKLEFTGFKIIE